VVHVPIDDEDSLALTSQCGRGDPRRCSTNKIPSLGQPVRGAVVAGPRRSPRRRFAVADSSITASPAPAAYLAIVNESNVA